MMPGRRGYYTARTGQVALTKGSLFPSPTCWNAGEDLHRRWTPTGFSATISASGDIIAHTRGYLHDGIISAMGVTGCGAVA